jgi:hypothetical protein
VTLFGVAAEMKQKGNDGEKGDGFSKRDDTRRRTTLRESVTEALDALFFVTIA